MESNQFDLSLTYESVAAGLAARPDVAVVQACVLGSQGLFSRAMERMAQLGLESAVRAGEHLDVFLAYFCAYYTESCLEQDKAFALRVLQDQVRGVARSLIQQKEQFSARRAISGLQAVSRALANDAEVVVLQEEVGRLLAGADLILEGRQQADVEEQLVDFRVELKQKELAARRKREEEERKRDQRRRRQ